MSLRERIKETTLLTLVLGLLLGLPLGLYAYDHLYWSQRIPPGAKVFTFTGNTDLGWIPGRVHGYQVVELDTSKHRFFRPVVRVHKGDLVVFRLTSSDVIHGFSLKAFGVFIPDGIRPGKVTLVRFRADKTGTFTFSCSIICGPRHKNMQGTLVVEA